MRHLSRARVDLIGVLFYVLAALVYAACVFVLISVNVKWGHLFKIVGFMFAFGLSCDLWRYGQDRHWW